MTKQEIFTAVATHLLTQNQKSLLYPNDSECAYRGTNGTKCAVGVLIKDEFYSPGLEHKRADSPHVLAALEKSIGRSVEDDEIKMLRALQSLHDNQEPRFWAERLPSIARDYKVTYEVDSNVVVA